MQPAVIFATQSAPSTCEQIGRAVCDATGGSLYDLATADWRLLLTSARPLLFVFPTYDGQPARSAEPLLAELAQCTLSSVTQFSVYGVGDNTYCDWFNSAAEQLVTALLGAGAVQLGQVSEQRREVAKVEVAGDSSGKGTFSRCKGVLSGWMNGCRCDQAR